MRPLLYDLGAVGVFLVGLLTCAVFRDELWPVPFGLPVVLLLLATAWITTRALKPLLHLALNPLILASLLSFGYAGLFGAPFGLLTVYVEYKHFTPSLTEEGIVFGAVFALYFCMKLAWLIIPLNLVNVLLMKRLDPPPHDGHDLKKLRTRAT